jgi:hypothetical protein
VHQLAMHHRNNSKMAGSRKARVISKGAVQRFLRVSSRLESSRVSSGKVVGDVLYITACTVLWRGARYGVSDALGAALLRQGPLLAARVQVVGTTGIVLL